MMNLENKNVMCVVAHPDDETIWMGGTILQNKNANWTIFSLCRANDTDRAPKFRKVCNYYSAKSIIADLDDENDVEFEDLVIEAKKLLKKKLVDKKIDYIFTHGENGEYGHDRHVVVNEAVKELVKEGFFKDVQIFYFDYKKCNGEEEFSEMIPAETSSQVNKLTKDEYNKKKEEVMVGIYGFNTNGIDANLCTKIEAFKS